jgi:hypothetical protein
MTYSLSDDITAFLAVRPEMGPSRIRDDPVRVPQKAGLYGWWFSTIPAVVPLDGTLEANGYRLLYVGIAPQKPAKSGSRSARTLRDRLLNHCRGPSASSTLRRTLISLLKSELDLNVGRTSSGKMKLDKADESKLSAWMDGNARATWLIHAVPWEVEDGLISGSIGLPLNIKGSSNAFAAELSRLRRVARD